MTDNKRFWWKVGYLVAIAILVIPLHWLGLPAMRDTDGGKLAQLRAHPDPDHPEYNLTEKNLGEIDASAETVKLGMLGLRGVAVAILWDRVNHYKMVEDWSGFEASLNQLTSLESHFYKFWDFQAHNVAYNTSVEFDDYHVRYHWVMEGVKFLKQGREANSREPRLTATIGWYLGNKLGKADEHRQFRRLFEEDDEFHNLDNSSRPRSQRDNWLVSCEYYRKAWDEVAIKGSPLNTTPVIFYSHPAMALIYYCIAIESDNTAGKTPRFGDFAKDAWREADRELERFGAKDIPSYSGKPIHLDALDTLLASEKQTDDALRKLLPGEFEKLKAERKPKMNDEEREALDLPCEKRSGAQQSIAIDYWTEAAGRADSEKRAEARKLAAKFRQTEEALRDIRSSRDVVNYTYWKTRCEAEPTPEALAARELTYKAGIEQQEARPTAAKKLYEQAFVQWRKVVDHFQVLHDDGLMGDDLAEIVDKYRDVLRQLAGDEAKFPQPFILDDMLALAQKANPRGLAKPTEVKKPEAEPKKAEPDAKKPNAATKSPEPTAKKAEAEVKKPDAEKATPDKKSGK